MMRTDPTPWAEQGEGHFFGLSKSDLAGDELSFRHLSGRPSHLEQASVSTYTRGTDS